MINIFHPQVIHCWVKQRAVPISSAEMLVLAPVIMTRHLLGLYKATITNINGHTSSLVLSSSFSQLLLFCSSQYSGSPLHSRLSSSQSSWLIFCFVTSSDCKTQLPQQHSPGLLPLSWVSAQLTIKYKTLFHAQIFSLFSLRQQCSGDWTSSPSVCCWL